MIKGADGEKGRKKDCHGKSADHTIIKVPVGTIVRTTAGKVVGDLDKLNSLFVAGMFSENKIQ